MPSLRDLIHNFRTYDATPSEKVAMAVRNNAIKIRTGSSCCGNHGQPGC